MMTVEISISAIAQHKKHLQVVFFVLRVLVAQYGSQPISWSTVAILSFHATTQKTELSWTSPRLSLHSDDPLAMFLLESILLRHH